MAMLKLGLEIGAIGIGHKHATALSLRTIDTRGVARSMFRAKSIRAVRSDPLPPPKTIADERTGLTIESL